MREHDHVREFSNFCRLDKLSGGPDAHISMIAEIAKDQDDPAWAAAVYVAVYNNPTAEIIRTAFPDRGHLEGLEQWLDGHWKGIGLRMERRRPVGSPAKLACCLNSVAGWIDRNQDLRGLDYETLWQRAQTIAYFGRYAQIKFLECLRRIGLVDAIVPDIRARGGWSAREGLALIRPDHAQLLLMGGDSPAAVAEIERISLDAMNSMSVPLDTYEFQVYLCNYKQCLTGKQYPGRSLDSELDYYHKIRRIADEHGWRVPTQVLDVRRRIFPEWALGELQGWEGVRKQLTLFYRINGYMWSDHTYDYMRTADFASPVQR